MAEFDFTALDSIKDSASQRAQAIPAQETGFIESLNELSNQQQALRTSTVVAKSTADQKGAVHLADSQNLNTKLLEANSNPFHDIVAFFDSDTQSTDELLAEQQKVQHSVQTLNNQYLSIANQNEFKAQSLQGQIDKLKTIEAVRSGNTNELATLLSVSKGAALNRNAIVMDELDKFTLEDLAGHVKKNTTGYEDGLVQLAFWNRQAMNLKRQALQNRSADKRINNQDWLTLHSPSVAQNKASMAIAQNDGKDVIQVNGRNIPIGDIDKWNTENQQSLENFMESSAFLATKGIQAQATITQVESLLPATLGNAGANIAQMLRIPNGPIEGSEQMAVLENIQTGLLQVPTDLQSDFAHLTKLRLQYGSSQQDRSALGVTKRGMLETAMIDRAQTIRDKLGKIMTNKYEGNKQAINGANEYIATGKIDNASSAAAILQSQAVIGTRDSLDSAALNTYYEGSVSLIGASLQTQMQKLYEDEQSAARESGSAQMDFMAWLNKKNKKAPPDEFMMFKAIEANAPRIKANAFGKISNIHLASSLRNFADKYKNIPEVATIALKMQDGVQVAGVLADPEVQAPKFIMESLRKMELQLKKAGKLPEDANLMEDFKLTALDAQLVENAITALNPSNELTAAVDTLLFRGNISLAYKKNIQRNFNAATLANLNARQEELDSDKESRESFAKESGNPILRDLFNVQKP